MEEVSAYRVSRLNPGWEMTVNWQNSQVDWLSGMEEKQGAESDPQMEG